MARLIATILFVSLFLSCRSNRKPTVSINPFQDKRESNYVRGAVYWHIENKSPWELDTAGYYFEKYLGDYTTIEYHSLTEHQENAFGWLSEIYYRRGDFKRLDNLAKVIMRFYSNYFRVVNTIWFNFSESNSSYPHNPEFDKKYTTYFKNLLGFGDGGKYGVQKKILETVFENDQRIRQQVMNQYNEFGAVRGDLDDSLGRVDSINISIVSDVIDQYGWLGPKDVGVKAVMGEFYTIDHADRAIFLKYSPVIMQAYKDGKLGKSEYELFVDRRNEYLHKKQIYGTQKRYDSTRRKWVTEPVKK